jgi:hypothetical protein
MAPENKYIVIISLHVKEFITRISTGELMSHDQKMEGRV